MLRLEITTAEGFDEAKNEFVDSEVIVLELEHSLVSLSKWESKWEVSFLGNEKKTEEQVIDYVRAMIISGDLTDECLKHFKDEHYRRVDDYIKARMTATTFANRNQGPQREVITAELIYYWMIALDIPFECQYWHLNRLLTLVEVCSIKTSPQRKMTAREIAEHNRSLNAQRRQQTGSRG